MDKKKSFVRLIAACISGAIIGSTVGITADAITVSHVIDNDPLASTGNTSYSSGFSYMTGSNCYNGDAQIASSGNSSYFYHWVHETTTLGGPKTVTVNLMVYLNHSNFTDPSAVYSVYQNGGALTVGKINQNLAAGGWNTLSSVTAANFTQLKMVCVDPSTYSGYYTGADAVDVKYYY